MLPDTETLERQLNQLTRDMSLINEEMVSRFTAEDHATMEKTAAYVKKITKSGLIPVKDAILSIRGDDKKYVEFMQALFGFAQVVKSHQRQGGSRMRHAGKVEPGVRRISSPK